jgi:hypothetical protein
MLNRVETIDKIIKFFDVQKSFGMEGGSGNGCSYITGNGDRCAIGCLMTEAEAILAEFELGADDVWSIHHHAISKGDDERFPFLTSIDEDDCYFLSDLQMYHDTASCKVGKLGLEESLELFKQQLELDKLKY